MADVTRILARIDEGDPRAAGELLPLVYQQLREVARARLRSERPGHTLQATALVHEAYLRLVGPAAERSFNGRGHFFAAAAEAMRRILVDAARRKRRQKRGGDRLRIELDEVHLPSNVSPDRLLQVDEALTKLAQQEPIAAEIVKLRYFAGLSTEEAAESLDLSRASAYRHWTYAKAYMKCELGFGDPE